MDEQPQVISPALLDSVLAVQMPKSVTAYRGDLADESGATRADVKTLSLDFQRPCAVSAVAPPPPPPLLPAHRRVQASCASTTCLSLPT